MAVAFNYCYPWLAYLHQNAGINITTSPNDVLKLELSNTATTTANGLYGDISGNEVASGNGYTTGGTSIGTPTTASQTAGTWTLAANQVVWTSVTADMGIFRYVTLYDSTPTTPLKPLIGWWDYGSSITLHGANGDTFTVQFNSANPGTIYTLTHA
jgi:hypothetical protein